MIGPLTKTPRRTRKVQDRVEASAWSLRCVNVGPKSALNPDPDPDRPQISYSGLRSYDPSVPLQRTGLVVSLPSNTTQHLFSLLHPGVTYQFSIRASTSKGFGQATTLNVSTNISGTSDPSLSLQRDLRTVSQRGSGEIPNASVNEA